MASTADKSKSKKTPAPAAKKPTKAGTSKSPAPKTDKAPAKPAANAPAKPLAKAPAKPVAKVPAKMPVKVTPKPAAKTPTKAPAKPVAKTPAKAAPKATEKPTAKAVAAPVTAKPVVTAPAAANHSSLPPSKAMPVKTETVKPATPKAASKSVPKVHHSNVLIHGNAPYQEEKNEDYMNPRQREHFRVILQAWKHELMEEVDRTVHHMQDESGSLPDPNDRATQEEEFSLELRTRDRERKLIKKIDQTIDRIDKDDYGYCDDCGVEIGVRRLEARPTATLCIDCKSLSEIKEKQLVG